MSPTLTILRGGEIATVVDELARLRIEVFREFPYLYDGDLEYEAGYLRGYAVDSRSLVGILRDEGRLVGATTAMPLSAADEAFQKPFVSAGIPVDEVFYFGESVILGEYRGRGSGKVFFDCRESQARELGYRYTAFCSVMREADHPLRDESYRPLDAFWRRLGYRRRSDLCCELAWKEVGESEESLKALVFWMKDWQPS